MKLVAGDVGGTKTLLQLVEVADTERRVVHEARFESGRYRTFDDLLREFGPGPLDAACFAVAGPVFDGRAEVTNLGWKMEAAALSRAFGIRRVALINDFYAVALGVPLLARDDLRSLQAGERVKGAPIGILGAGTGLGEAVVTFNGEVWNVIPTEGGHADFAPQDEEQAKLFLHLRERHGHVSWERVLSGMGLVNIDNFVRGLDRPYDDRLPATIVDLAEGGDEKALQTMAIFVDAYGAEAGNLALHVLARGGVFLAGGIAAKNIPRFTDGKFIEAFRRKGRFSPLMEKIPVDLITNPKVGLIGAVEMAVRTLNDEG
ncbi:MAG TPA: glucokinase [Thermoanaerobaculia bacterium]|jgi:glucokinase|nr:glucokinase [Thermoanaerobaculia bacterium]